MTARNWQGLREGGESVGSLLIGDLQAMDADVTTALAALAAPAVTLVAASGDTTGNADTAAIQTALTAGQHVQLVLGETYWTRSQLSFALTGQRMIGNGAIVKRIAQTAATTATTITSGVTNQVTLSGGSNPFKVGDYMVLSQGGATGTYDYARQIAAITGQAITISGTFEVSLSGTTNVYLGGNMIYVPPNIDNCRISDLTLDGNVSNWTLTNWGVGSGIFVDANHNTLVDHCRLVSQIGDAFTTNDSVAARFVHSHIDSCAGRGVSLGGSGVDSGCVVAFNRIHNAETNASAYLSPGGSGNDGHGAINFSLGGKDCVIDGNQLDTGIEGIGGLGSSAQSGAKIINNTVRTMSSYALDGTVKNASPANDVQVIGNQFYSCGNVSLTSTGTTATGWLVRGNIFVETALFVESYQGVTIDGNYFYSATVSAAALTFITLSIYSGTAAMNAIVKGNILVGGRFGIVISSNTTNVLADGNYLVGQYDTAIQFNSSAADISVDDNQIVCTAAGKAAWNGIQANATSDIRRNLVDLTAAASSSAVGINLQATACVVTGNTVKRGSSGATTIQLHSAATHAVIRDNTLDAAPFDSTTTATKTGNTVNGGTLAGQATLVGGTVTVSTAEILSGDSVILSNVAAGGTVGVLKVGTITAGTSFVINSSSGSDTSTVYWEIRH